MIFRQLSPEHRTSKYEQLLNYVVAKKKHPKKTPLFGIFNECSHLMKCNYATFKIFFALSKVAVYFLSAIVAGPVVTPPV
ncbi:MAG: hypothetical protein RLZZ306_1337 [Bacteroidota bacterium]